MSRSRIKYRFSPKGTWDFNFPLYSSSDQFVSGWDHAIDEVLPGDGYPFSVESVSYTGGVLNRTGSVPWFNNYTCGWVQGRDAYASSHLPTESMSDSDVATNVINRSNPNRADADLPIFIGELKDLPDLVRGSGRSILKRIASGNLKYQFGIRPMLSDIQALINFTASVDRRAKELDKLFREGTRKTVKIGTWTTDMERVSAVLQSAGTYVTATVSKHTVEKVSGHIRWFPNHTLPFPANSRENRALAAKVIGGLTVDAATVWELIPWSWLIDWYAHVGTMCSAARNIIPCHHSMVQVMRHTITRTNASEIVCEPGMSITPIRCTYETKSRSLASPSLSAHLPILTGGQMSILGSLAALAG